MDLIPTRTTLHAVAELLLAGPQHEVSDTVRLRVVPGGIATVAEPDLRLEAAELVGPGGRHPLTGTYADLAAAIGVTPTALSHVYGGAVATRPEEQTEVDAAALDVLLAALARGDAALRAFAPASTPVLWPEHLDVAISVDEVNYGVSPGDTAIAEPYAYVGPWTVTDDPFWDQPFGATRPVGEVDELVSFFTEGAARAAAGRRNA